MEQEVSSFVSSRSSRLYLALNPNFLLFYVVYGGRDGRYELVVAEMMMMAVVVCFSQRNKEILKYRTNAREIKSTSQNSLSWPTRLGPNAYHHPLVRSFKCHLKHISAGSQGNWHGSMCQKQSEKEWIKRESSRPLFD